MQRSTRKSDPRRGASPVPRAARLALLVALAVLAAPTSAAWAGRILVTGHDADLHCNGATGSQCHYFEVATNYVRAGSTLPVLILDKGSLQAANSFNGLFPGQPSTVVDPSSPEFARTAFVSGGKPLFSAIIVASDASCGGCDLNQPTAKSKTPDSDAINARRADFLDFFNAGGGIMALAGGSNGGNACPSACSNVYYEFLPIPAGGQAVSAPFTLTPIGQALGLTDADINCCPTHNSFKLPPPGGSLRAAETDSKGLAETLVGEGSVSKVTGVPAPRAKRSGNLRRISGKVCVRLPKKKGQKKRRCVPIDQLRSIPVGSLIDTTRGVVELTVSDGAGGLQSGLFSRGQFLFTQADEITRVAGKRKKQLVTRLGMRGGGNPRRTCPRGTDGAAAKRRFVRYLQARAQGRFRVIGRRSSGIERGTEWLTRDNCAGTLTKVTKGAVLVTDFAKRKTILVRAGQQYLATRKRR